MSPLYVTAYTPLYAEHAAGLIQSLQQWGLTCQAVPLDERRSWAHNCALKPGVIYEHCARFQLGGRQRPIVWLDADARVRRRPVLFEQLAEQPVDVAYHLWGGTQLASGTLYFGATPQAAALIEDWGTRCARDPDTWDQQHLQDAVEAMRDKLVIASLPIEYLAIFDAGVPRDSIVIEHLQASREMRERVGT